MDFFNSLTLDLKMLVIGIAGAALLALFSGNQKSEKRYVVLMALLTAAGVYRFTHMPGDDRVATTAETSSIHVVTTPAKRAPLVSTSAR
jgi:hypothetical protein